MSFEEEWSDLVRSSQERQSTGMQLNQATTPDTAPSGSSYSPDLVVHDDQLGKIGNVAASLFRQIQKEGDEAREETFDAATSLTGQEVDMGAGLLAVHDAWNTQTGTVKEACAHISNHLDFTRKSHGQDEDKIRTEMRDVAGKNMTPSRIQDYIG